jgi:Icc-related predicted phosphoesterase
LQFDFYMGFQENDNNINPGLGFGSIKHHWLLQQLIKKYEQVSLIDSFWKEYNPDPETITAFIESFGINLSKNKTTKFKNTVFLSSIYLDPLPFLSYKIQITKKAYSLHHYAYTWADKKNDFYQVYKKWTEFTKNKK